MPRRRGAGAPRFIRKGQGWGGRWSQRRGPPGRRRYLLLLLAAADLTGAWGCGRGGAAGSPVSAAQRRVPPTTPPLPVLFDGCRWLDCRRYDPVHPDVQLPHHTTSLLTAAASAAHAAAPAAAEAPAAASATTILLGLFPAMGASACCRRRPARVPGRRCG